MRQPSLQSVVASCNDKNKAANDTVFAFTGAGIPLDKLDHPLVRASVLMAAINLAQSDGPVACFVYDKMKDVQFHWEDTLQRKILHPRIEEALKKLPRSADSIRRKFR